MTDATERFWRDKIADEIQTYRLDSQLVIADSESAYVTGLIRAEILARKELVIYGA